MEYYKDLEIANQFMESAPSHTLGYSPALDGIVDYLSFKPDSPLSQELHSKEFIPYFLVDLHKTLTGAALNTLNLRTPVDQTILFAFAQTLTDNDGQQLSEEQIEERFDFTIRQVHCLDYLDYIRRIIQVITDKAIDFEMDMWAEYESATILANDEDVAKWYEVTSSLPYVFQGWSMEDMLDASAKLIRRIGRMMEVLGEHYSCEMIGVIMQRPQHIVGSYAVNNNVAVR